MSFQPDPFTPQEDVKRSFGRQTFANFNNIINGAVGPQQHMIGGPFRESGLPKYTAPTVIDVFGSHEPPRPYDFNGLPRDFGSLPHNKPPPPHHNTFHPNGVTHHNQTINSHHHGHREEEISTIFVVGFPDDMQEREFQNMFTFAKGFEAASLKIPHKEHNSTNGIHLYPPSAAPFNVNQDPFNVVSPNEQLTPTWPVGLVDDPAMHAPNHNNPPRKQIIGFAKFRSRNDALEARDFLQGRKVDVERGALLKAEMAKKNLHTKRGPGPSGLPLSMIGQGGMVGQDTLASLTGLPGGAAGLPSQSSGEAMRDRERELGALGAMGFINTSGQRHRERENSEKDITREPPVPTTSRMRFGNPDSDSENTEPNYHLRQHNQMAFDAFHAVPAQQQQQPRSASMITTRSVLSPTESFTPLSPGQEGPSFPFQVNGNGSIQNGPWGPPTDRSAATSSRNSSPPTDVGNIVSSISGMALSSSPQPVPAPMPIQPPPSNRSLTYSSSSEQLSTSGPLSSVPASCSSSINGSRGSGDEEGDVTAKNGVGSSASSTGPDSNLAESPPEYPSLPGRLNSSDQNPPINTLYVGNLPTSPPPPGFSTSHLEDNLRGLFSQCPGYRKLCFRQKDNGPMCFVEFDDVGHATKALNDLYGNQLNGLVKTGIRLSYSKNPLGVRPGGSQMRHNGFHHNGSWSTATTNGSMYPQSQETPQLRPTEGAIPPQRSANHRDSIVSNGELSPIATQYSFLPPQSQGSRFFSPPVIPSMFPLPPPKPTSNFRGPSSFSPFQTDFSFTPVPRDHGIHTLTPSPSIESARAG